jgi:hypothetical protein
MLLGMAGEINFVGSWNLVVIWSYAVGEKNLENQL